MELKSRKNTRSERLRGHYYTWVAWCFFWQLWDRWIQHRLRSKTPFFRIEIDQRLFDFENPRNSERTGIGGCGCESVISEKKGIVLGFFPFLSLSLVSNFAVDWRIKERETQKIRRIGRCQQQRESNKTTKCNYAHLLFGCFWLLLGYEMRNKNLFFFFVVENNGGKPQDCFCCFWFWVIDV